MEKTANGALHPQTIKCLKKISNLDLLVGIPSYNNAHTINYVVYQVAKGLSSYFPELNTGIFVSDGHSKDGTLRTVMAMKLPFKARVITAEYAGISGKGSAVKAIFEAAMLLDAKAVALVDSDLRSITPEWVKLLISPTLEDTGLVAPLYIRDKYDGTITNFLCYPMTSSLYYRSIRQPIGGDFGLSKELVKELLDSPLWQTPYIPTFGIDIFETHTALAKDFKVKQAFLGAKIHEPKDPAKHLAPMFRQVVGSLLSCVEHYEKVWRGTNRSQIVETISGTDSYATPEPVSVDVHNLLDMYRNSFQIHDKVYRAVLDYSLFRELDGLRKTKKNDFCISPESWARSVYSFVAHSSRKRQTEREELIEALRTLWIGKVASYIIETEDMTTSESHFKIEEEAETFQKLKPFLLDIFSKYSA